MQKFFVNSDNILSKQFNNEISFQISTVLRFKGGEKVLVSDQNDEYLVKIIEVDKNKTTFEIIEKLENNNELPVKVDIFQGYPKGDKMEDIIKHSTELGVSSINPVFMKRSVVKLDDKKIDTKIERFSKIAKEAAEQSFRTIIPSVNIYKSLKSIDFNKYDIKIVCYEESAKNGELTAFKTAISKLNNGENVAVVIGPEGGIDETEIDYLTQNGFICCSLGKRILRTETAPLFILSSIAYQLELKSN